MNSYLLHYGVIFVHSVGRGCHNFGLVSIVLVLDLRFGFGPQVVGHQVVVEGSHPVLRHADEILVPVRRQQDWQGRVLPQRRHPLPFDRLHQGIKLARNQSLAIQERMPIEQGIRLQLANQSH